MKILISGYYGFGNLGDDLLMISTYKIVKTSFPDSKIHLLSNSNKCKYIYQLTDEDININGYKTLDHHYNLIIHGGGGIHFDYTPGGLLFLLLNKLIRILGVSLSLSIFNLLRKITGSQRVSCNQRIGLGIGLGPYSKSSKKYLRDIGIIKDYDYLFVRDKNSYDLLKNYRTYSNVFDSTDMIYLMHNYFFSTFNTDNKEYGRKKICVILRDWKFNNNSHVRNFIRNINDLRSFYTFNYLSLDGNDHYYINSVQNIEVYQPSWEGINKLINTIKSYDLIITSRAHGAYLGSILNIPSICINIEPKLKSVHETLSNSTILIPEDITSDKFNSAINMIFSNYDSFLEGSKTDLSLQKEKASVIAKFFEDHKNEFSRAK